MSAAITTGLPEVLDQLLRDRPALVARLEGGDRAAISPAAPPATEHRRAGRSKKSTRR